MIRGRRAPKRANRLAILRLGAPPCLASTRGDHGSDPGDHVGRNTHLTAKKSSIRKYSALYAQRFVFTASGSGLSGPAKCDINHKGWGVVAMSAVNLLDLVGLTFLMERSAGHQDITIGLIDGPVVLDHPDLASGLIREIPGRESVACSAATNVACMHGTFVAGVLLAKRGSAAPAICPDCTLLVRPIFSETANGSGQMPTARPEDLAAAIIDCVDAGAHVINMSLAVVQPSVAGERALDEVLHYATKRGVIAVVAAGNQGALGSTAITRHPWVIPVAACDLGGRLLRDSNFGFSIGTRGLRAPGDNVTSLGMYGESQTAGGTSAAAAFVTGAIALLQSEFPGASPVEIKLAIVKARRPRRATVTPPLLDAWGAHQILSEARLGREA